MQKKNLTSRQIALTTLKRCERSGQYSNIALDNALRGCELSQSDRALTAALFYGVIERKITLDHYIEKLSSRPLSDIDEDTLWALRLGIYQLKYLDRIPDHAAINETVSLCSRRTSGFVNAILRSFTRQAGEISLPDTESGDIYALSVKYSVCEPLVKRLCDIYGAKRCESILSAFCKTAPTTLRANTLKISRDELCERVGGEKTEYSPYGIRVKGDIASLSGFDEGLFYVQDEASQICAAALGAREGELVVDTCSCPGSKSFGIAIDMKNSGELYSFDLHGNKLSLVELSAKRLGINIISTEQRDARKPREELLGRVDRVLCDVPCSGFGVLAKKPEIRYKDPEVSKDLPAIQRDILEASSRYLRSGGVLVYSTCTVFPEENEENIRDFLKKHGEFSLCPFEVGGFSCAAGMVTLLPDEYGTDGFFIAKLVKR